MVRERLHNGSPGLVLLPLLVLALGIPLRVFMTGVRAAQLREDTAAFYIIGAGLLFVLWVLALRGFFVVAPNEGQVLQLFGSYAGTAKTPGLRWANPF